MTHGTPESPHHHLHHSAAAAKPLPMDKTRRKRLKVVSACGECRRKKTKCNGEHPCSGCIKANVECKYTMSSAAAARANGIAVTQPRQHFIAPQQPPAARVSKQHCPQQQRKDDHEPPRSSNIHAIEQRLAVIEDILRALLASSGKSIDHGDLLLALDQPQVDQQEENLMATYYYSPPQKRPYDDDNDDNDDSREHRPPAIAPPSLRPKGGYPPPSSSSVTTPAPPAFLSSVQLAPLKRHPGPSSPSIRSLLNDTHTDPPDEVPSSSPLSSSSSSSSSASSVMSPILRQPQEQHPSAFQRVASNAFS